MFLLNAILKRLVKQGRLRVTDYDGRAFEFGDPAAPLDSAIALTNPDTAWRIARNPALNIGEAYTDGSLLIQHGTLLSLLRLLILNNRRWVQNYWWRAFERVEDILSLPAVFNPIKRSRKNVKHHYDLSDELFSLFLDDDRQYSCAYYRSEKETLASAQLNKKQHITAKLDIRPNQHVLDIGSGWGGLAIYIARHYPVRVTGLTLSDEQHRISNARARQLGLADRVAFKLADYRLETEQYDRIVSVGMFEHVGKPHFSRFFSKLHSLLAPGGVALLHTIGFQEPPGPINPWLRRNIFPGAYLPSLSQLAPILERQRFWLADFENLRLHYALTLAAWHERFQANRDHVVQLYDERFCRMWEYYLQACEAGFRWSGMTVFQLQLTKEIGVLPITRDYMLREEERLRRADLGEEDAPYDQQWPPRPDHEQDEIHSGSAH